MNEIGLTVLLILGLASFRLTRLIVFDKITEPMRRPFFNEIEEKDENGKEMIYLVPKERGIRKWIGELLSCYWCTGIWVSIFLIALYLEKWLLGEIIIIILAVAAIGSILEVIVTKSLR
ncbi:hypothetical protein J2S13_002732 [Oikeobacillus pervagus]|uniref:DUF1360 domain-containing protein n=1 Tax=Oikeobacillus pervagus TaxID=1325931 RepID=A0AAJ1T6Y7_9BACI|nr:DUF1360 domain-containing protein [Oikeobacillus pervagus]MDQ0216291.1 hypothetical protein [Oikeobacillus pervagus]